MHKSTFRLASSFFVRTFWRRTEIMRGVLPGFALLLTLAGCPLTVELAAPENFSCESSSDCADGNFCAQGVCHADGTPVFGVDAGDRTDAGENDSGILDAGSNIVDSGLFIPDAGSPDAGTPDAGIVIGSPDRYELNEDQLDFSVSASDGVLSNDDDSHSLILNAEVVTSPLNGSLTLLTNGSFTYKPNADFNGEDSFTYTATSSEGETFAPILVRLLVRAVNDAPVAQSDDYIGSNSSFTFSTEAGILANDFDIDNEHGELRAVLVEGLTADEGTLLLEPSGGFTYTAPSVGYSAALEFSYRVTDGELSSEVAFVSLIVSGVNGYPIAARDRYEVNEDETLVVGALNGVLKNDFEPDGETLRAEIQPPLLTGLSFNEDGSFTYTPADNFNGEVNFSYAATDGTNLSTAANVQIVVLPVQDAPVISSFTSDAATLSSTATATLTVVASDIDNDPLTYAFSMQNPSLAGIDIVQNTASDNQATITFSDAVPKGEYRFDVEVTDGFTEPVTASLMLAIENHLPQITIGTDVFVLPGESVSLSALATDIDNDALTYEWSLAEGAVDGLSFTAADNIDTLFSVARGVYLQGPAQQVFTVNLSVSDGESTQTASLNVTVLDERGPYVDANSIFSGKAAGAYCGALLHPCNNLDDGLANFSAAKGEGLFADEENLIVAYREQSPLLQSAALTLKDNIGLDCGYLIDGQGNWNKSTNPSEQSLIESSANVIVKHDASSTLVFIDQCSFEGVNASSVSHVGINILNARLELQNSTVIAAGANTSPQTTRAVLIDAAAYTAVLKNNILTGEAGAALIPSGNAVGLDLKSAASLEGNRIRGGRATRSAFGIRSSSAANWTSTNDHIEGGQAETATVALLQTGTGKITLVNDVLVARTGGITAPSHIAVVESTFYCGFSAQNTQFLSGSTGFENSAGDNNGVNIKIKNDENFNFMDNTVDIGEGETVGGIWVKCNHSNGTHSINDDVTIGLATQSSKGVFVEGCGLLTLSGSVLSKGGIDNAVAVSINNTDLNIGGLNVNVLTSDGALTGMSLNSSGLSVLNGSLLEVTTGNSTNSTSTALKLSNSVGKNIELLGPSTLTAGEGNTSFAVLLAGHTPDSFVANDVAWSSSNAVNETSAFKINSAVQNITLTGGTLTSGDSTNDASSAVHLVGSGSDLSFINVDMAAGNAGTYSAALLANSRLTNTSIRSTNASLPTQLTAQNAGNISAGIELLADALYTGSIINTGFASPLLKNVTITTGSAPFSVGLRAYQVANAQIVNSTFTIGHGENASTGIRAVIATGLTIESSTLQSGSSDSFSRALHLDSATSTAPDSSLTLEQGTMLIAGAAPTNAGLYIANTALNVALIGSSFTGGEGLLSQGAFFGGANILNVQILRSEFTGGTTSDDGGDTVGLSFEYGCNDCILNQSTLDGGDASGANSTATALRTHAVDTGSFFINGNVFSGGSGINTTAIEAQGHALDEDEDEDNEKSRTKILHNQIGSGTGTNSAVGVRFSDPAISGATPNSAADLVGNNFVAEIASNSIAVKIASCSASQKLFPKVVRHQNFHDGTFDWSVFLAAFDSSCTAVNFTDIAALNASGFPPLSANLPNAIPNNLNVDSLFELDGISLQTSSPLIDKAFSTDTYLPAGHNLVDYFGTAHISGDEYDIGAHSVENAP